MINIIKENNGLVISGKELSRFFNSDGYLNVPLNSIILVTQTKSDIVIFKSASDYVTLFQTRWDNLTIEGELVTKENIIEKFNAIANAPQGSKINAGTNITLQEEADGSITISATGELGGTVAWQDVTDKPSTFTPSAHTHLSADITDLQGKLDEKANVSDIPNLDGYATEEWVNSQGYLTEHQDISQLATKSELATKQDTLVSGTNIKTINGQDILGEGNIEIQGGGGGIADAPSDGKKYVRQNANWVEETTVDTSNFATKAELDGKVDDAEIADMLTKTEAASTYQPKGEYLTAIPDEYVTETELNGKGYLTEIPSEYVTDEELSGKGYATTTQLDAKLDTETYNSDKATFATKEELADKANTSDLSNYVTTVNAEDTYAKKSEIPSLEGYLQTSTADEKYATKTELEGKVDDADIADMLTKTEAASTYQPKGEYLTSIPDEYITETELDGKGYKKIIYITQTEYDELPNKEEGVMYVITDAPEVVIPDTSTFATKEEVTEGLSAKQDKGNYLTVETAQSNYQPIGDYATKAELANKVDNSTYTEDKATFALKSELTDFITASVDNLVNYYKKSETYTKGEVDGLINAITTINFEVVAELPVSGEANKIYLVPNAEQGEQNVKDEYIWVDGKWEIIGSTKVDLSNYYNKGEVDSKLSAKVDLSTYTSDKATFALKSELTNLATKEELNGKVDDAEIADMLTKTEAASTYQPKGEYATTSQLATKQDTLVSGTNIKTINGQTLLGEGNITIEGGSGGDVTKQYVDEQLALKADKTEIVDMLTKTEASTTYALQTALQAALDRIAALETQVGNISAQLDSINGEIIN